MINTVLGAPSAEAANTVSCRDSMSRPGFSSKAAGSHTVSVMGMLAAGVAVGVGEADGGAARVEVGAIGVAAIGLVPQADRPVINPIRIAPKRSRIMRNMLTAINVI